MSFNNHWKYGTLRGDDLQFQERKKLILTLRKEGNSTVDFGCSLLKIYTSGYIKGIAECILLFKKQNAAQQLLSGVRVLR